MVIYDAIKNRLLLHDIDVVVKYFFLDIENDGLD